MRLERLSQVVLIAFVLAVFPGVVFCGQGNAPGTSPKIHVPEPKYEFNTVVEGQNVLHDFVIQNKGNATLDIVKVRPG